MTGQFQKPQKCEATGKTSFETEAIAKEKMASIKAHNKITKSKKSKGKPRLIRIYYCDSCKGYHFTSFDKFTPQPLLKDGLKYQSEFRKLLDNDKNNRLRG